VLARAREAGLKTSIDVVSEDSDRFAKIVLPTLPHVDLCIMNEFEAGRATARKVRVGENLDRSELRAAMQRLLEAGVRERVVVHFPEGGCALDRAGQWTEHGSVNLPTPATSRAQRAPVTRSPRAFLWPGTMPGPSRKDCASAFALLRRI
jgi:sugar/nucleoside kinase (ribokinase family)